MARPPVKFLCYNFWQTVAHHHMDVPHETEPLCAFEFMVAADVRDTQVVFVKTDLLDLFISDADARASIRAPFALITGHSDVTPSPDEVAAIRRDPGIVRWHAMHCDWADHKTVPIPIGLAEPDRVHGDQGVVEDCMREVPATKLPTVFCPAVKPTHPVREALIGLDHPALVRGKDRTSYREYLTELGKHAFALCPRGNGIDIHRVYEAILMKTVPIYFSDRVPALYAKLPVIVVQSVSDLRAVLDRLDSHAGVVDWDRAHAFLRTDSAAQAYGINIPAKC